MMNWCLKLFQILEKLSKHKIGRSEMATLTHPLSIEGEAALVTDDKNQPLAQSLRSFSNGSAQVHLIDIQFTCSIRKTIRVRSNAF